MSELGTKFSHENYCDLILMAIRDHPLCFSKVAEKIRRADTDASLPTTGGPRTTAKDLQNLSQIDFLELIAEIVSLHPLFIVKVREACQRAAGRCPPPADADEICPPPVDYDEIQAEFDEIILYRGDHDPDIHGPLSDYLQPLVEKVEESVNFSSSHAVLNNAFRCLCAMEKTVDDEDAYSELDDMCIVEAKRKVGAILKGKRGPTRLNGVGNTVKTPSRRDYDEVLEQVSGCAEQEICSEVQENGTSKPKSVANPRKRVRVN